MRNENTARFGEEHIGDVVTVHTLCQRKSQDSAEEACAYEKWLAAAKRGDAAAMTEIGRRLYDGIGIQKDRDASFSWYLKAAEAGDPHAMHIVAYLYASGGEASERDEAKALEWYDRAAAMGDEASIRDGAILRATCRDLPQDAKGAKAGIGKLSPKAAADVLYQIANNVKGETALAWLRESAEAGNVCAMMDFGLKYCNGLNGQPPDYQSALAWFRRAADMDVPAAMSRIGDMYYVGDGVPQDDAEAFHWYEKAAAKGFHMAIVQLGRMYYLGRGVSQDFQKAYHAFHEVATSPENFFLVRRYNSVARQYLGKMYAQGAGVPMDETESIFWYELAAEDHRNTEALCLAADRFLYGEGSEKNIERAIDCLEKAAENVTGVRARNAMQKLAWIFELGEGVSKDDARASICRERLEKVGRRRDGKRL